MTEKTDSAETTGVSTEATPKGRPMRLKPRALKFARRAHLYAGLFLLPWVFLYGITGAMYNHQGLFPVSEVRSVSADQLSEGSLNQFPGPDELAEQVVVALQAAAPGTRIALAESHGTAFNNPLALETQIGGAKHVVRIDPVELSAEIFERPVNEEQQEQVRMLGSVHHVRLTPNPYEMARSAVPGIASAAGLGTTTTSRPQGWCKLNFLAEVDGDLARVTYVLRDGHVDVAKFTGEDGMMLRQTFLRLHSFHGRSPGWSARNTWSLFIDAMAIAMVMWGVTGLVMWWQLKSVRVVGGIVLAVSAVVAIAMFLNMEHFHAMTRM